MLKIKKESAGSGKTYKLAQEYITLLLGYFDDESNSYKLYIDHPIAHDTHKRILAITFTIKATEEMKSRIIMRLYELSSGAESDYLSDLMELYKAPEEKVRAAAKKALRELLYRFSFFNVSTIDSFFQMILRAMAYELDQNGEFAIEINDDAVLNIALQDLVGSLRMGTDVQPDERRLRYKLEKYLMRNIDNRSDWNILPRDNTAIGQNSRSLGDLLQFINSETFKLRAVDIDNYFKNQVNLDGFRNDVEMQSDECIVAIVRVAHQILALLSEHGVDTTQMKYVANQPWKVILKAGNMSAAEARHKLSEIAPNTTYLKNYDNPQSLFKASALGKINSQQVVELLTKYVADYSNYAFLKMCIENLDALSLIYDVYKQMEKYRDYNDTFLLSQTTEFLSRIISKSDTPFIYERMGIEPKHFLIDEFQDTSKMQWKNLEPMVENSLGDGHDNLIIGDVKQSIYRFRNAEPKLLHSEISKTFENYLDSESKAINISINHRSSETVVKFNNTFFTFLTDIIANDNDAPLLRSAYSNVVQHTKKKGGYVTVTFSEDTQDDNGEGAVEADNPNLQIGLEKAVDALQRGYKPSQIAFLDRSGKANQETAKFLIDNLNVLTEANGGVPVSIVSDESLLLKSSPAINTIIGMLQFLAGESTTSNDDSTINRNQYLPLIAQYFHRYWFDDEMDASQALQLALEVPVSELRQALESIYLSENQSLFNLVERIIESMDSNMRNSDAAYLFAFQDLVVEYTNNYTSTIPAFLKWWDSNSNRLSVSMPPNENAINVLTIHKSKGLEYAVVIIPNCKWSMLEMDSLLWLDSKPLDGYIHSDKIPPVLPMLRSGEYVLKSNSINRAMLLNSSSFGKQLHAEMEQTYADSLNLTYVAFTRAINELHIIAPEPSSRSAQSINGYIKRILEIPAGGYTEFFTRQCPDIGIGEHFLCLSKSMEWGTPESNRQPVDESADDETLVQCELSEYTPADNPLDPDYTADIVPPGPRGEGIRLHKVMEGIRTPSDVEHSVKQCVARGFIEANDDVIAATISQFHAFISQDEPRKWFSPGNRVLCEQPLLYRGKQQRADRIVIFPGSDDVIVVDFKFGEAPDCVYDSEYTRQMQKYIKAVKGSGFKNVTGKIWHPESGNINTVTTDE